MLPSTVASEHSPTVAHEMPQAFAPCGQRGKISIRRPPASRLIQTRMRVESHVLFRPRNNEAVAVLRQFRRNLWGSRRQIVTCVPTSTSRHAERLPSAPARPGRFAGVGAVTMVSKTTPGIRKYLRKASVLNLK